MYEFFSKYLMHRDHEKNKIAKSVDHALETRNIQITAREGTNIGTLQ